jgi:crotonobetaine/carnitine-CoA ligase
VAVHAVPGDFSDDEIKACIVLRSEESVEISELFEYFKRSLPYFAIPRYIEILDSLPINAIGRVQKHLLRDRGITDNTIDLDSQGMRVSRDERRAPPVRRSQKGSDTQ